MANHCYSTLTFDGPAEALTELREAIAGDPDYDGTPNHIDFERIVPIPPVVSEKTQEVNDLLAGVPREAHVVAPYDWRRENWGTAMVAFDATWGESKDELWFGTKWTPPVGVVLALSRLFPTVTITHSWYVELTDIGSDDVYRGGECTASERATDVGYEDPNAPDLKLVDVTD